MVSLECSRIGKVLKLRLLSLQKVIIFLCSSTVTKLFICVDILETKTTNEEGQQKEPIERRSSKEDGSDSSKDSSLQSDTSVDSEDSFASVIFVPKSNPMSPTLLPSDPTSPKVKTSSMPTSPKLR